MDPFRIDPRMNIKYDQYQDKIKDEILELASRAKSEQVDFESNDWFSNRLRSIANRLRRHRSEEDTMVSIDIDDQTNSRD